MKIKSIASFPKVTNKVAEHDNFRRIFGIGPTWFNCDGVIEARYSMQVILKLVHRVRVRTARGFAISSLGPNESRIAYDLGELVWGLVCRRRVLEIFCARNCRDWIASNRLFADPVCGSQRRAWHLFIAQIGDGRDQGYAVAALHHWNLLGGDFSSYAHVEVTSLWALIVTGPITLARILLGLQFGKNRSFRSLAFDPHGPVLIIGGAGYIGSETVGLLLKQGKKVRVLDRLMYGIEPLSEFLNNPNFEFIEGDSTDITKLTRAMKDAASVVHLAGLVGDPACGIDTELTRHTNIIATRMAKDVAQSLGVRRFVFASSCSVYGASDREVSELDDLNPVSLYAQTKIDSEQELLPSVRDDFFVTILRFATVFGHSRRPRFDLVGNLFTAQAMTNGLITVVGPDQWRPFVHVSDLARAIVLVLNSPEAAVQGQIFNVGDKRMNLTIMQLAEMVRRVTGSYKDVQISVRDDPGDKRNYVVSFEKIRTILGFECQTFMEAGLQEIAERFVRGTV